MGLSNLVWTGVLLSGLSDLILSELSSALVLFSFTRVCVYVCWKNRVITIIL